MQLIDTPEATAEADVILGSILDVSVERGAQNHFRLSAPECASLEISDQSLTVYIEIPGEEKSAIQCSTRPDGERELYNAARLAGLHACRHLCGILVRRCGLDIGVEYDSLIGGYRRPAEGIGTTIVAARPTLNNTKIVTGDSSL